MKRKLGEEGEEVGRVQGGSEWEVGREWTGSRGREEVGTGSMEEGREEEVEGDRRK